MVFTVPHLHLLSLLWSTLQESLKLLHAKECYCRQNPDWLTSEMSFTTKIQREDEHEFQKNT